MNMEVSSNKPFDVVFTFVRHPYFGMLVEANAVQLLTNGEYSLTFQRIRLQNAAYYHLNIDQTEAVKLIEDFEVDSIMKKFYVGTKKIRPTEFFTKHYDAEVHKRVREYIEKKLGKVLDLVKNYPLFNALRAGEASNSRLEFSDEPATVLFHFRKDESGINYFATIKHQNERVEFYQNESEVLTNKPAWLLTPKGLLHFGKFTDGNKIRPFLNKKFIHVEPRNEDLYLDKFVKPLLENHDVYAVGFDIITEQFHADPILRLMKGFDAKFYLGLFFKYGTWSFPYHVNKRVNVSLDKKNNTFLFHRIRRNYSWENDKISELKETGLENAEGSLFQLSNSTNSYELLEWLNENAETLRRSGFRLEQEQTETTWFIGEISIGVTVNKNSDWFDVQALVNFGKFQIPFTRLRKNILEKKREFILPDGTVAILPEEWFSRFARIAHLGDLEGESFRLKNMHFSLLDDLSVYLKEEQKANPGWESLLIAGSIPSYELPAGLYATLRTYQEEGYNWIRFLFEHKMGALLADDMGLGKTLQTLAVLEYLNEQRKESVKRKNNKRNSVELEISETVGVKCTNGQFNLFDTPGVIVNPKEIMDLESLQTIPGPCIVIAPKSLLYNWQNEARKFTPGLKVVIYGGVSRSRMLKQLEGADVVIMSYGTMRNDTELLSRIQFQCIVLDESQAIKNPTSLTARSLLKLHSDYKLALTGTPIENTLLDIWSQMNFLNPGLLGSYGYFEKQFIKPIEKNTSATRTTELRKILNPFLLRRTKKQVASELPEKIEKIHYCEMGEEQAALYDKIKSQYRNEILEHVQQVGMARSRLKIFNGLMHLRQLALNPLLKDEEYQGKSGKDDEIYHMLLRALEGGHKVLLFSQFVSYLKIYRELLEGQGIEYTYLDGSMDAKQREQAIHQFQNDPKIRVFLLSLRAGNSGINLTEADYVFLVDPWWNPFTMKQAEDRAHRIGQKKTVFSYKFITKNTIEEKILKLQQKKMALADSILPDENSIFATLDIGELEDLFT